LINSKRLSLGVILTSATLTIMAGSIIAPVLNVMRDGLGIAPSSEGKTFRIANLKNRVIREIRAKDFL